MYPCLRAPSPPHIDGRLDDAAWKKAIEVSGFSISGSRRLAPVQMVMRLVWDDRWLYMAVEIDEPAMDKTVTTAYGRDGYVFNDDSIEWFVDPWHTHKDYYQFGINMACAMWDSRKFEKAWDCNWRAAVRKGEDAWYVECAMPLAELSRKKVSVGAVWGFNLCRQRQASGRRELFNWANVFANFHRPKLFGHLLFLNTIDQLTPQRMMAVAKQVGRPAAFFVQYGWWRVDGKPTYVSYAEDLHQALDVKLRRMLSEARRNIDRAKFPKLWQRYRQLRDRWYSVQRLSERNVTAPQWARARPPIDALEEELPDLLWRARLSSLIESL